jgi:hypothetical protein
MRRRTIHIHDVALVTRVRDAIKEHVCSTLGYDDGLVSFDEEVPPYPSSREVTEGELVATAEAGTQLDAGDRLINIVIFTPVKPHPGWPARAPETGMTAYDIDLVSRLREAVKEHLCSAFRADFTGPYEEVQPYGDDGSATAFLELKIGRRLVWVTIATQESLDTPTRH